MRKPAKNNRPKLKLVRKKSNNNNVYNEDLELDQFLNDFDKTRTGISNIKLAKDGGGAFFKKTTKLKQ